MIAMVLTGVAIAYSTVIFQTITHNRILTPSIMGFDSLYLLLQTVVIFFLGSGHITIVNKHVNFILSVSTMIVFALILYSFYLKREVSRFTSFCSSELSLEHFSEVFRHFYKCLLIRMNLCGCKTKCLRASIMSVGTGLVGAWIIVISHSFIGWKSFSDLDVLSLGRDTAINLGRFL